ncbi:MAG: DUF2304 domain-containing protein [Patescibacteria group bacterium]|nr:DUF2304 domain-containing protein [Patescibacteria group bacterium]
MLIQFIIILFSLFAISRLQSKLKTKEIILKEFYLWLLFWVIIIITTLWFRKTDIIAKFFGVEKGADLAIYISIIFLFYLLFKLIVKIKKIERDITKITREIAIKNSKKD